MFEQLQEGLRKASESAMIAQQELMKQWMQQLPWASPRSAQGTVESSSAFQRRWLESATETLTKQRELLDSACEAGVQLVAQTAKLSGAKSAEDYRQLAEELWRKMFELVRNQSEAQLQQLMKASQAWLEAAQQTQQAYPAEPAQQTQKTQPAR
jgi:hypothetical protein